MSLIEGVTAFTQALEKKSITYGVIGGLAVFAYGGERTTFDVDLLVHGDAKEVVKSTAQELGFTVVNENSEVLQFSGPAQIDVIFANRPLSQAMLTRLRKIARLPYPVVSPEDLIGLKVQAFAGDRRREYVDKGDILSIMRAVPNLDFEKIKEYADIFKVWDEIQEVKKHL